MAEQPGVTAGAERAMTETGGRAPGEHRRLGVGSPPGPEQLDLGMPEIAQPRAMTVDELDIETETAGADHWGLPKTAAARQEICRVSNNQGNRDGRPRGIRNHKTEWWLNYLLRKYTSPLETLLQFCASPVDALAAELVCTKREAAQMKLHALATALPYVHARLASITVKMPGSPGMPVSLSMLALAQGLDGLGEAVAAELDAADSPLAAAGPAFPVETWDDQPGEPDPAGSG
jgi:hypothetical protein